MVIVSGSYAIACTPWPTDSPPMATFQVVLRDCPRATSVAMPSAPRQTAVTAYTTNTFRISVLLLEVQSRRGKPAPALMCLRCRPDEFQNVNRLGESQPLGRNRRHTRDVGYVTGTCVVISVTNRA